MRVEMLVASDEATSGSVIENADRVRPSSSGASQRSCCAGVPNRDSNSMLPVSGAEQLNTSGARNGLRPMISHSGAYCMLVRPAPWSVSGKKRFHSPASRAITLRSSMTGGVSHGFSIASIWAAKTGSAGRMCSA
jgi:hypothetical protein